MCVYRFRSTAPENPAFYWQSLHLAALAAPNCWLAMPQMSKSYFRALGLGFLPYLDFEADLASVVLQLFCFLDKTLTLNLKPQTLNPK